MIRATLTALMLAVLVASAAWVGSAGAQNSRPAAGLSFAQAERKSIDLRLGMSLEEVRSLLGSPRRTALKSGGGFASAPAHGTLHWTYAWSGANALHDSLSVVFTATGPEKWHVASWEWSRN